jgi:AAA family ATPase
MHILSGIPNESGRREILEIYVKKLPHTLTTQDIENLASITHGYSGADLYSLCKEAALKTLKRTYHMKPIGSSTAHTQHTYTRTHTHQSLSLKHKSKEMNFVFVCVFAIFSTLKCSDSLSDNEIKELRVTIEDFHAALREIRPSAMREVDISTT